MDVLQILLYDENVIFGLNNFGQYRGSVFASQDKSVLYTMIFCNGGHSEITVEILELRHKLMFALKKMW